MSNKTDCPHAQQKAYRPHPAIARCELAFASDVLRYHENQIHHGMPLDVVCLFLYRSIGKVVDEKRFDCFTVDNIKGRPNTDIFICIQDMQFF